MRELQKRLEETEKQMSQILSAMQHVSTKVNTVADGVKPDEQVFKFICLFLSFFMVVNATFDYISVILWQLVLLVEKTRENHHDITEMLLKVVLNTLKQTKNQCIFTFTTTVFEQQVFVNKLCVRIERSLVCK